MITERTIAGRWEHPFPLYPTLVETLAAAHLTAPAVRDATVAHVLGTCAGYAYADVNTVAAMTARIGFERPACVCISQAVDAMYIFSTAYLVQSRCGRVALLCYRGTEFGNLANWFGNAEVGSESSCLSLSDGAEKVRVHSGFYRNFRATSWEILRELGFAVQGRSLADHAEEVEHPLEALYVTGHSLGGAMAALFALTVSANSIHRPLAERLRAVYTFGQPMAVAAPLPKTMHGVEQKLFRHIIPQDPIPALPPAQWGPFVHFGQEYRYLNGEWRRADSSVAQMAGLKEIPRSLLTFFAPEKRRASRRYTVDLHGPHHYIAALRPNGLITEFGD